MIGDGRKRIALIAGGVLVALAIGFGAYAIGHSTGQDLGAARSVGAAAGQRQGAEAGRKQGYKLGFAAGRKQAYRAAFDQAFTNAYRRQFRDFGIKAPAKIPDPSP